MCVRVRVRVIYYSYMRTGSIHVNPSFSRATTENTNLLTGRPLMTAHRKGF